MFDFIFYILPIIFTIVLTIFYSKYIDKDESKYFVNRIKRWIGIILCFIPFIGIFVFAGWILVYSSYSTFKENKLIKFFIEN